MPTLWPLFHGWNTVSWNVEYTDEFGAWWATLSEGAQEDIAAIVTQLEARGPQLRFLILPRSKVRGTVICENCACKAGVIRCGCSTPSIPAARRSFSSAANRRATVASMCA